MNVCFSEHYVCTILLPVTTPDHKNWRACARAEKQQGWGAVLKKRALPSLLKGSASDLSSAVRAPALVLYQDYADEIANHPPKPFFPWGVSHRQYNINASPLHFGQSTVTNFSFCFWEKNFSYWLSKKEAKGKMRRANSLEQGETGQWCGEWDWSFTSK